MIKRGCTNYNRNQNTSKEETTPVKTEPAAVGGFGQIDVISDSARNFANSFGQLTNIESEVSDLRNRLSGVDAEFNKIDNPF